MNLNIERDFKVFAKDHNVSGVMFDDYHTKINSGKVPTPFNLTPYILEERQMNVTTLDVFSRLMKDRVLFFNESVTSDTMGLLIAQSLYLANVSDDPIKLYLNSPGGEVVSGLGFYDTLMTIAPRIETTVMGMGASMGSVLGTIKKLHKEDDPTTKTRSILKHSRIMLHDIRGGVGNGTYQDMEISLNLSKQLRSELFQILANHSGKTKEEIETLCDRDYWLTSEKALENNFVDHIISYN